MKILKSKLIMIKKLFGYMPMLLIATMFTFLVGCSKNDVSSDSLSQFTTKFELKDFKKVGNVYTEDQIMNLTTEKKIGDKPENALVSIVLAPNGKLFSPKGYNEFMEPHLQDTTEVAGVKHYYTDLKTFESATKMPEAKPDYVGNIDGVWIFDAYQKFYETREQQDLRVKLRIDEFKRNGSGDLSSRSILGPLWGNKGNILYGRWSGGVIWGHTGGVAIQSSYSSLADAMRTTYSLEVTRTKGVYGWYMTNPGDWNANGIYVRIGLWLRNMSLSSTTINSIVRYQNDQYGKSYNLSYKNTLTTWYCSKLQWYAYKQAVGIDLDSNGGDYVYPYDILNSSYISGVNFGLV